MAERLPAPHPDEARSGGFESILSPHGDWAPEAAPPPYLHDLGLDQVIDRVIAGRAEYELAPFFWSRLPDAGSVVYRQAVAKDLEKEPVRKGIARFSASMRAMRNHLARARRRSYRYEAERWLLAAVEAYCDAVEALHRDLERGDVASPGLRALLDFLQAYVASAGFATLAREARTLAGQLGAIRYCLHVDGPVIVVRHDRGEADYCAEIERTFEKFRRGHVKDYRNKIPVRDGLNHVEAEVLARVALLEPGPFRALEEFAVGHAGYLDPTLARFDREVQFYVAWLDHVDRLRGAALRFCYPAVSATSKEIHATGSFDVALADKLAREKGAVVPNDLRLTGAERFLVVTGPNHGGKTTFARAFGQLHHLAALGGPVPGEEARLFLPDAIFTHFERREDVESLRGKLEDELVRVRDILGRATPRSLVVMNEAFSSTTIRDAVWLARQVLRRMFSLGVLGVCVTFLDELASLGPEVVSMVATVDPHDLARRTFQLERRRPDGLAYALAVAERHRVTYEQLTERMGT